MFVSVGDDRFAAALDGVTQLIRVVLDHEGFVELARLVLGLSAALLAALFMELRKRAGLRGVVALLAVLAALRIYGAIGRRVGSLGSSAWDQRVSVGKTRKLAYLVPTFAEAVTVGWRR